jgi:hypothetical protein
LTFGLVKIGRLTAKAGRLTVIDLAAAGIGHEGGLSKFHLEEALHSLIWPSEV